ncbi:hypothetical protein [Amycolatopsis regifaucium]|uniref:Uncharacterized protein n=1 Tax=Amycolatopsis regifaucium TaxID=546365 RepID=A0A154MAB4_9PSEU|nr:hypothetical protein [Amycolatopsis regifaucium]KZB81598.1 hypothetical protein AVL48_06235 [Amycolatopsis regifaucium]OKA06340.1 hypothetical protein ATP06_0224785 [Amycolatopsis regifaucium]
MNSEQQECDLPAGETGRARSAASGRYQSSAVKAKRATKPATGRTKLTGHGIRRPEPVANETSEPHSLPSFLGMFDLPADASERVKAVVRDQDVT